MNFKYLSIGIGFLLYSCQIVGQEVVQSSPEFTIQETSAIKLGHSDPIIELKAKLPTSKEKKAADKRQKKAPDNFRGRRGQSMASNSKLEHQGEDKLWQKNISKLRKEPNVPIINIDGIGDNGSPHDPTGDVSDQYYVQAVNVTDVGVFDLEGNLVNTFAMNTLWSEFGSRSLGDPIILYDEHVERWLITEFTTPSTMLIAVSDDGDPLGGYTAFRFNTPDFPDYPKYALSPKALVITTNEDRPSTLHNYFVDLEALYNGEDDVRIQRVGVTGSNNTEAGFYVATPADWNGFRSPYDDRPISLAINDSSWNGGPAEDQVELYSFDVDFDDQNNTQVIQTSIILSPFDGYPCASTNTGGLFPCIPQRGGGGLDGVPEIVMNIPHLRNFGTHESLVFNFITDATNGNNISAIRWVELRRTETDLEWKLYQEGTFAPDDGLHRFMGSIAIDESGNIGLAYNVSSQNDYVGVRYTGRKASDPLGIMTEEETEVVSGLNAINSGSRFGDYAQMSVSPNGDNTFWHTTEYAGNGQDVTKTRIVAFKVAKDSFDLSVKSFINPTTNNSKLSDAELVVAEIVNSGIEDMSDFDVGLIFEDNLVETINIQDTLSEDEKLNVTFTVPIDLSAIRDYNLGVFIDSDKDKNVLNDSLFSVISKIAEMDLGILASIDSSDCNEELLSQINLQSFGEMTISNAEIQVQLNGVIIDTISYNGSLSFNQGDQINYEVLGLTPGLNEILYTLISINGLPADPIVENNSITVSTLTLASDNFITFVLNTDRYPEETTWQLTLEGSTEVIESGDFDEENQEFRQDICVPLDQCFTLTVFDSEDDGICCGFGSGNFSILNSNGETLVANDGDFASEASETFCAGDRNCLLEVVSTVANASASTEADGVIMLSASNGVAPYRYSIDGGQNYQETSIFEGLLPDTYTVVVIDADSLCTYSEDIIVDFEVGVYDVEGSEVAITVLPNPTDGIFKLKIENLSVQEKQLRILVYDMNGRIIQSRLISKYDNEYLGTFSLYDYSDGIYFVRIKHLKLNILEKVIKH